MKWVIVSSAIAFFAGTALALVGGALMLRQNAGQVLNAVGAEQPGLQQPEGQAPVTDGQLAPEDQHRLDFSLAFGDIINDLQPKQGFEHDHYAFSNLITIDQNTISLLNKITKDASSPQLKQLAEKMKAQREAEVGQLYSLQKSSGHAHH